MSFCSKGPFRLCGGSARGRDEGEDHRPPVVVHRYTKPKVSSYFDYKTYEEAYEYGLPSQVPAPVGVPDYGVGPDFPVRVPDWLPPVSPPLKVPGPRRLPVPVGGDAVPEPSRFSRFGVGPARRPADKKRRRRKVARGYGSSRGAPYGTTVFHHL